MSADMISPTNIWTVDRHNDAGAAYFQQMDSSRTKCAICFAVGVVAYAYCAGVVVDAGIGQLLQPDVAFQRDYPFCAECAVLAEHRDLDALLARRLAAIDDRYPVAHSELAALLQSLEGRDLVTADTHDFRLGFKTGFAPGTLGDLRAPDEREPDCHRWIEQQGPIELVGFETFKETFRHRYSYAIPNRAAIDAIARYSPNGVLDFGAGNGYWKFVLEANSIDVRAMDQHSLATNPFWREWSENYRRTWSTVSPGTVRKVSKGNALRSLLLVWPPYDQAMADEALEAFNGETVIYVGEWRASTGEYVFHNRLKLMWRLVESVAIPTLFGFFDRVRIFVRRPEEEYKREVKDWAARKGRPIVD
jgi:hypothetical protein